MRGKRGSTYNRNKFPPYKLSKLAGVTLKFCVPPLPERLYRLMTMESKKFSRFVSQNVWEPCQIHIGRKRKVLSGRDDIFTTLRRKVSDRKARSPAKFAIDPIALRICHTFHPPQRRVFATSSKRASARSLLCPRNSLPTLNVLNTRRSKPKASRPCTLFPLKA